MARRRTRSISGKRLFRTGKRTASRLLGKASSLFCSATRKMKDQARRLRRTLSSRR